MRSSWADFYASRIIRIKDGKVISDEINEHADNLDYRIENKIYLKDIQDHKRLKTDHYNVDFYNESGGDLDLDIVIRNGNLYIRTNKPGDRIEIVNEDSSIEFVDDHYRKLSREDSAENSFDPQKLATSGVREVSFDTESMDDDQKRLSDSIQLQHPEKDTSAGVSDISDLYHILHQ